ncbi:MAG TPA: bi-domain-containing oxidoreductase [Mycobacterium sp.]|nr:bi-domain-containing oxidoreductase [Mycobacterium sp.]
MKQAVQNLKSGEVSVQEVPPPRLHRGGALVATMSSLISAGTERSKIELGEKSMLGKARARPELVQQVLEKARQDGLKDTYRTVMQRLEAPNPLGYSAAGRVVAVGADVPGIEVGDLVACSGAGYANHAEVNFIPKHLLARVPDGVDADQAAYGTLGCIAMHGVRQARLGLGDRVLVVGLGLVGLVAAQLAAVAGARVFGTDLDPAACALAERLGVERAVPRNASVEAVIDAVTDGVGVDAVLICAAAASNDPIELAARLARDRARVVLVGHVGLTLPRDPFYNKEIDLRYSRSYGPGRYDPGYEEHGHDYPIGYVRWTEQRNLGEFLRLIRDGRVDVGTLTTHRFPVTAAADAYALISGKGTDTTRPIGVLLQYPDGQAAARRSLVEVNPRPRTPTDRVGVGMVGAGNFATRVLLPALTATRKAQPVGVTTSSGATARRVAETYGFDYATSDSDALINDPAVDAVVVATRHDSHAKLTAKALRAGKAVFCEKPLATTWDDLEEVSAAWSETGAPLLVGFNRRFSPLTENLRAALPRGVPRVVIARCNAGPMPHDHWMRDPISGGGRIVGELCHFLDLACALAEGEPRRISAEAIASPEPAELADTLVVQVSFSCGSVASLQYLGNGDPSIPKERIEVYGGGVVGIIDDFVALEIGQGGKRNRSRGHRQEKGHREEMRAFVELATGVRDARPTAEAAFWSSALTLQVPLALAQGQSVAVDLPQSLGGRGAEAGMTSAGDWPR